MDDRELLALLCTDPENGLWALTQKYGALIRTVVGRILPGAPQDAEECAADALIHIWRDCSGIRLQNGTLRGFVIWTARSAAIDRYRRLRRTGQRMADGDDALLAALPAPDTTDSLAEGADCLRRTEALIRGMPPPDDEILLRRYFLCETVPQIAKRLQMNVKAVESRLLRSRRKLQEKLLQEGVTLE